MFRIHISKVDKWADKQPRADQSQFPFALLKDYMPLRSRLTRDARDAFLMHLAQTANVSASCAEAGVSRRVVFAARARSRRFSKAWDAALETALDALEAAVLERALQGTEKTHYFGGKAVGTEICFSDTLAMFLLKARRPSIYGDVKAVARGGVAHGSDRYEAAFSRLAEKLGQLHEKSSQQAPTQAGNCAIDRHKSEQ